MSRYRKSDVEFRGDYPAVNVKTQPWNVDRHYREAAEECGYDPDAFVEWAESQSDELWTDYFEMACESAWEMLDSDLQEIFGNGKIYQEGRSGGWAVVHGLEQWDYWDAVMLAKWRRFEKWARSSADDIPRAMAVLAAINGYQSDLDECARNERTVSEYLLASL